MLTYDPSRDDERELVRAVSSAAALTLENQHLATELRAKVEELSASRTRLVESGDAARRRLERDLHDGAQQRLVSLALSLRMFAPGSTATPARREEVEAARERARPGAGRAARARPRHPSRGAQRPRPEWRPRGAGRAGAAARDSRTLPASACRSRVETAAYFVVAEALTNVAKYAQATEASVSVRATTGMSLVEVPDDGVGGADPAAGPGLRGLADPGRGARRPPRADSPPGDGTTLRARLPVTSA